MSTPAQYSAGHRFAALDGWRGVCALLVALLHFHATGHLQEWGIVQNAHLFVDFFFVLSGFVLSFAYLDRLKDGGSFVFIMWRRLARLWPLHAFILAAFVLLELAVPVVSSMTGLARGSGGVPGEASASWSTIVSNFLLLHGLGIHDRLTWNFPSWSISTEFWTYLVFGFVALSGSRFVSWIGALLALAGVLVVAACSTNYIDTTYDYGFFRCLYGFFVGHLVYRLMSLRAWRITGATCVELGSIVLVAAYVAFLGDTAWSLAAPIVFGAVVFVFGQERGAVSGLLGTRPFLALGAWSYSIYMVHSLVLAVMHRALNVLGRWLDVELITRTSTAEGVAYTVSFGNALLMDALSVVYLGVVIGLAALTWRFVEMPAQRWMNRRTPILKRSQGALVVAHRQP